MKNKLLSDNANEVVRILFCKFGLKYDAIARQRHQTHPLYPSFPSIAYILSYYGVESCLIETNATELTELQTPVVINYDGLFLPVDSVTESGICILEKQKTEATIPWAAVNRFWSKTALVFDTATIKRKKTALIDLIRYYFNKAMQCVVILFVAVLTMCLFFAKYRVFSMAQLHVSANLISRMCDWRFVSNSGIQQR